MTKHRDTPANLSFSPDGHHEFGGHGPLSLSPPLDPPLAVLPALCATTTASSSDHYSIMLLSLDLIAPDRDTWRWPAHGPRGCSSCHANFRRCIITRDL